MTLPPILRLRIGYRLPLHVRHRVRSADLQSAPVIFNPSGARAVSFPRRRARVLALKLPCDFAGTVVCRSERRSIRRCARLAARQEQAHASFRQAA